MMKSFKEFLCEMNEIDQAIVMIKSLCDTYNHPVPSSALKQIKKTSDIDQAIELIKGLCDTYNHPLPKSTFKNWKS